MWLLLAIGASVFAALTSILAKIGIDGVNSTLATAIRTFVVLVMSWGMVFIYPCTGYEGKSNGWRRCQTYGGCRLIVRGMEYSASTYYWMYCGVYNSYCQNEIF